MNERIQELARQASVQTFGHIRNAYFEKKFAELIVRECVDVARQADIDGCNIGNYAWEKIKQHFGVEE